MQRGARGGRTGSRRRRVLASGLVWALTAAVLSTTPPPAVADGPTVPDGFQLLDIPTGQAQYNLTDFFWLDDGDLLTSGKDGTITFVPSGGEPRVLTKVPDVRATGDHGLLGFAPANDYATSGRVFVSYDKGDPASTGFGMVELWRASPADDPTSFTRVRTLIDGGATNPPLAQTGVTHGIDSVVVAPDDTLFLSVGEDSASNGDPNALRAQDLATPYGKVLHVDDRGAGVPANPFYDPTKPSSWRSRVYAYGFRNPFRLSLDPRSGRPTVGDVGWRTWEEINTVRPGGNAGWPCYEGAGRTVYSSAPVCQALYAAGTHRPPTWTYRHVSTGAAVVGGFHYTGTSYPQEYRGAYFFGDYSTQTVYTMQADADGVLTRAPEDAGFAGDAGGPVAFHPGPNGDVTYADLYSGQVRRLVHAPGNRAPVARIRTDTDPATRTVSLSAEDSYDLDRDQLAYSWDLGDGAVAEGAETTHTYAGDGPVTVTLRVRDPLGATSTATTTVHPSNHTPQLTLEAPDGRTYAVGEPVELAATAVDTEDGPLSISWDTALLHCPFAGSCHLHPDGTRSGDSYREAFPDHGTDTTMVVTARAQDSTGAVVSRSYTAAPRLRTLSVAAPVGVTVNGIATSASEAVAASRVEVAAPRSSSYWRFQRWSDGGAAAHALTMPDADLRLTASYATAIALKHAALGGRSGMLGAATGPEIDLAGGRSRTYSSGRILWSAATGAHEVHGPVLAKYLRSGGPLELGFPLTDRKVVRGGAMSVFTEGRIYHSSGTGAHLLHGRIARKYAALGAQRSCLGFPSTDVQRITGGSRAEFEHGRITVRTRTGAVTVRCS